MDPGKIERASVFSLNSYTVAHFQQFTQFARTNSENFGLGIGEVLLTFELLKSYVLPVLFPLVLFPWELYRAD